MVIEVSYEIKKDATDPYSHFKRTEYFEADAMLDRRAIVEKLLATGKDLAAGTLTVSEEKGIDAATKRSQGFHVSKF
jgi:hypothetical protein